MQMRIALAGNPNSGKTTLFNTLTGSNQYVGNWPGVTVEKKEGKLKKNENIIITDLPGIYSLSPYTLEEVVARNYLIEERPDAILNIVDGTNLERNLYLTTQLMEIGIPVVVAINMMDVVRKLGDKIDTALLAKRLKCPVTEISALKNDGIDEAADLAIEAAQKGKALPQHIFSGTVEHAIAHIEEAAIHSMPEEQQRFFAIKLFERDRHVLCKLKLDEKIVEHMEHDIKAVEEELDDDAEAVIINERYLYIDRILKGCYIKKSIGRLTATDKIDRIVTNRILAIPIFILAMLFVYMISIGTVGNWTVTFMNDGLFGSFSQCAAAGDLPAFMGSWVSVPEFLDTFLLDSAGNPVIAHWLYSLIMEGIVAGVGAILGFVPQMLILFLLLSLLEDCGYMARVAFIMDRLFRKFGLSGKSFIPMLVGTGCSVPGIMASRTIESDRDRKITIMTTSFIPCGAKMPVVGLIASSLFGGSAWVATSAYFIGVSAVVVSGVLLKKLKAFSGDPAPFVMELPSYHAPVPKNFLRATWERGWSFIKRAGTVIFAASVIIWVLNSLSFDGGFHYIDEGMSSMSILEALGSAIAWVFAPLGFGNWQSAVATIMGLMAKEEIVSVLEELAAMGGQGAGVSEAIFGGSRLAGYSFLVFNLLCAPCFAAMGAIKREMNNFKWTAFAISYLCVFAYMISLIIYQFGLLVTGNANILGLVFAVLSLGFLVFMVARPNKNASFSKK